MSAASLLLRVHPADDLIVALQDLPAGAEVSLGSQRWCLREPIPAKHKFAGRDLAAGELVVMYGVVVGRTRSAVPAGARLTTENLAHAAADFGGKQRDFVWQAPDVSAWRDRSFRGFKRSSGVPGTANHWIVVPLVFCENRNLAVMREALTRALGYGRGSSYERFAARLAELHRRGATPADLEAALLEEEADAPAPLFPNLDGVKFLEHGLGCGGTRQDAEALCRLLAGYIAHPNVAGATVLSLGCQHAQVSLLEKALAELHPSFDRPLQIFEQQKSTSEKDMLGRAIRAVFAGAARAAEQEREPCPIDGLVLGVECGGSDGFSGLSANPVIGRAADLLAASGGTPVLSEFPELCGVEQDLCDRCETPELANKFTGLMRAYEKAAQACGSGFEANPSPGNIRDGLITDAMKSAGAAKKGGSSPVIDVIDYGEPVRRHGGLNLCCTPGNDVESTTALAAAGCNLIVFSTGLGTPTGNPVCPTLKVATNTGLMRRMSDILDFDAGPVLTGEATIDGAGEQLLELCLATASGEYRPKAVALGQDDFLPWKRGVSL